MLQGEGGELADAFSRLCVMRTEDYTLLRDIKHAAKADQKLSTTAANVPGSSAASLRNQRYLRHVASEFRQRECWRSACVADLLSRQKRWAQHYYRRESLAEAQAQLALGAASTLYAEVRQAMYHLDADVDLMHSPFAAADLPSRHLYDRASVLPATISTASAAQKNVARHVGRAQETLFGQAVRLQPNAQAEGMAAHAEKDADEAHTTSPSQVDAIADVLYSLSRVPTLSHAQPTADVRSTGREQRGAENDENDANHGTDDSDSSTSLANEAERAAADNTTVTEGHPDAVDRAVQVKPISRERLRESRHVWIVFFLLWCHALIQRQLSISSTQVSAGKPHAGGASDAAETTTPRAATKSGTADAEEEALLMSALLTSTERFLTQQRNQFLKVLEAVEALAG